MTVEEAVTLALAAPTSEPVLVTAHARVHHFGGAPPAGTEILIPLAGGARLAYVPEVGAGAGPVELKIDPFVRGNAFTPLHASATTLAAQMSVAASRRVEMGPESERLLVILRGHGLLFLENGDTLRFAEDHLAWLPAGVPARLWAQDSDVLAIVIQPRGEPVARRTLASEIAKRRADL